MGLVWVPVHAAHVVVSMQEEAQVTVTGCTSASLVQNGLLACKCPAWSNQSNRALAKRRAKRQRALQGLSTANPKGMKVTDCRLRRSRTTGSQLMSER